MSDSIPFRASLLQERLARKRYLFEADAIYSPRMGHSPVTPPGYEVISCSQNDMEFKADVRKWLPSTLCQAESANIVVNAFVVRDAANDAIAASGALLSGVRPGMWYDNIPLLEGEGRIVGMLVDPLYRGQGLGTLIQRLPFFCAINDPNIRMVSAVVESHRVPSLKTQRGIFNYETSNWLIKAAGRNILSVVADGEHKGLWYVGPGRDRRLVLGDRA